MAKKPILTEEEPVSLINMDPAQAARSIDAAISKKSDEFDFLSEIATIQFYNIEQPGRDAYFCYGDCRNPERINISHGEIRELSRAAIRFIESRQIPIYEYRKEAGNASTNQKAKMVKTIIGWKPRYQCREVRSAKRKIA